MNTSMLALVLSIMVPQDPLMALETTYGFKVEILTADLAVKPYGYKLVAKAPTKEQMDKYRPLFLKEWKLYPPSLPKLAKMEKLIFGQGIAVNGQLRAACPAFDLNTMLYDPELGSYNSHYQRTVIHHEFFHLVDWRMKFLDRDPDWIKLNPKGFKYGTGGANMRTGGAGELTDTIPGFLTPYGTAAVEEDKAELFAHLIVDATYVKDRTAKDPVIKAKVALLKSRLAKFDPAMGTDFWAKVGR